MRWLGSAGLLSALWRWGAPLWRAWWRVLAANLALAQRTAERDILREAVTTLREEIVIRDAEIAAERADNAALREEVRRLGRGSLGSPDDSAA